MIARDHSHRITALYTTSPQKKIIIIIVKYNKIKNKNLEAHIFVI